MAIPGTSVTAVAPPLPHVVELGLGLFHRIIVRRPVPGGNQVLRDIAVDAGLDWVAIAAALKAEGRLHLETY